MLSRPGPSPVHTLTLGAAPDALALDASGGSAVAGSVSGGTLSLLDLTRGRVLRTVRVGPPRTPAPLGLAIASSWHHLFVTVPGDAQTPGVVQMRDSRTGSLLRDIQVGDNPRALAVDARRGRVLVANAGDGTVSLIDARSGALLRTTALGLAPLAVAVDERTAHAFVSGPAVPGAVTLPTWEGSTREGSAPAGLLSVLDTRTGALLGSTALGTWAAILAVDERTARVFVAGGFPGTVSVLDARNGTFLHATTLGGQPAALAIDERRGRVYIVNGDNGTLSLLDARDGALLRTVHVDPTPSLVVTLSYALAVDEARDRVYLSTRGPLLSASKGLTFQGCGTLYVLDASTGMVLRRIGVGVAPIAVAVEKGSGRVVVANGGGDVLVRQADDWLVQGVQRLRAWLPWLGDIAARPPQVSHVPASVSLLDAAGL
jgi:DNA-binding beta-propeller fold protein YncE